MTFVTNARVGLAGCSVARPDPTAWLGVLFNGKHFEAPLPDMATGVVVRVIASHLRGQQPLHPSAEIPIMRGPEGEMKMIGHQAVRQDTHRQALRRLPKQIQKGLIVSIGMKHLSPGIAPIDGVVAIVPR